MSTKQVRARAWPARPDPTNPPRNRARTKSDDCNGDCGPRPSEHRVGAFMLYTTASTGVTSCGKHGSECGGTAAGLDAQSIASVEEYGVARFLEELGVVLRAGEYRPEAVLRRYIPKADGKRR